MKRVRQPDETINSMMKREQPKPRRSKDRVKVSFFILSCRFHFFSSSAFVSIKINISRTNVASVGSTVKSTQDLSLPETIKKNKIRLSSELKPFVGELVVKIEI